MESRIEEETLCLSGKLGIDEAEQLLKVLKDYVHNHKDVIKINLAEVEALDITALQLLFSARRTAKQAQKNFELNGINDNLQDAFQLSGLGFLTD